MCIVIRAEKERGYLDQNHVHADYKYIKSCHSPHSPILAPPY